MNKEAYMIGLWSGILCVLIVGIFMKQKLRSLKEYDERQKIVQGTGYKLGFFTMMFACMAYGSATLVWDVPVLPMVGTIACAFLGVGVFAVYCIWNDAYFGIKGMRNKVRWLMIAGACVVLNIISALRIYAEGEFIEDGVIGVGAMNLLVILLFLAILSAILVKTCLVRQQTADESELD